MPIKATRAGPGLSYLFFADDLLLFSEAVEDQVACLKEGLQSFCKASGQRVNYSKSMLFVSSNIELQAAEELSASLGIPLKKELGR